MGDRHPRKDETHRLDEALKQIRITKEKINDETVVTDLEHAASLVEAAQGEMRSLRDAWPIFGT